VTGRTEAEARKKAAEKFKVTEDKVILRQGRRHKESEMIIVILM
jgi:hypothetical protein